MKTGRVLIFLCIIMGLIAGCALPVGDDYTIPRNDGPGTTYITGYNLQTYVPIPNTGEQPVQGVTNRGDVEVKVLWKDAGGTAVPLPFEAFLGNTVYQAEITVIAKNSYVFYPSIAFAYPEGKVTSQHDDLKKSSRHITVTYNNSDDANIIFITNYNLQRYVPIPLAGEKPVRRLTSREDLSFEAAWKVEQPAGSGTFVPIPDDEAYTFDIGTVYQAAIRLKTKLGYRFVKEMKFEYTAEPIAIQYGASTPNERNLTLTYAATKRPKRVDNRDLTPYILKPTTGIMPVKSLAGTQYTGTVLWKNAETGAVLDGPFQGCAAYKAEVTLSPTTDYSFTGTGKDFFTHTDAAAINNPVNSGIITISFPPTGLTSFGPVTADNSALKLLNEKKGEGSLTVELPGGAEMVTGNSVTLAAGTNSPAQVVIDGHNRVLTIAVEGDQGKRGKLLTVGKDVTLTLQNITLWGTNENDSPLVEVGSGGTLILGTGVVLKDNRSSGDAGGVWVNGGKLIMNTGSEIKNMTAHQAGGVLISAGEFIMNDGIIQENSVVLDKKTVIGGGVFNAGGTFIMNNGSIYRNTVRNDNFDTTTIRDMVGGVFNGEKGVFTMNNGSIRGNIATSGTTSLSGDNYATSISGGVLNKGGAFAMYHGVIQENSAAGYAFCNIGGGVLNREGTFVMHHGIIQENNTLGYNLCNIGGGVFNGQLGIFNMNGGTIGGEISMTNRARGGGLRSHGVYNGNVFTMSGGIITGNTVSPNDEFNNGVLNNGTFTMTGSAKVAQNNGVLLYDDTYITIGGNLTASPPVATIRYYHYIVSTNTTQTILSANTPSLITENYFKFYYDGEIDGINEEGKYKHPQDTKGRGR